MKFTTLPACLVDLSRTSFDSSSYNWDSMNKREHSFWSHLLYSLTWNKIPHLTVNKSLGKLERGNKIIFENKVGPRENKRSPSDWRAMLNLFSQSINHNLWNHFIESKITDNCKMMVRRKRRGHSFQRNFTVTSTKIEASLESRRDSYGNSKKKQTRWVFPKCCFSGWDTTYIFDCRCIWKIHDIFELYKDMTE